MDLTTIRTLYRYSEWANERLLRVVEQLTPEQTARVRDMVAHIVIAEHLWLQRWKGESPTELPEWHATADIARLRDELARVARERQARLDRLTPEDLQQTFRGQNLKRDMTFEFPVGLLLLHVANHSTYHRGQLAALIRESGGKPAATDLTVFAAERGR